jgi:hypothetical protein
MRDSHIREADKTRKAAEDDDEEVDFEVIALDPDGPASDKAEGLARAVV